MLLHTGHVTLHVRLLELATLASIPPDRWPPNSSDLNPVDYKIWIVVQLRVYQSWVHNVDEFEQRLVRVWHGIDQTIIDNATDEWCGRLRAYVWEKGGHFEQVVTMSLKGCLHYDTCTPYMYVVQVYGVHVS